MRSSAESFQPQLLMSPLKPTEPNLEDSLEEFDASSIDCCWVPDSHNLLGQQLLLPLLEPNNDPLQKLHQFGALSCLDQFRQFDARSSTFDDNMLLSDTPELGSEDASESLEQAHHAESSAWESRVRLTHSVTKTAAKRGRRARAVSVTSLSVGNPFYKGPVRRRSSVREPLAAFEL